MNNTLRTWVLKLPPEWAHGLVLLPVGLFAFCHNLNLSLLEGSEGLYSQISREMIQRDQFLNLTFQGEHYTNKPPFFFWLLAASTTLFGENEVALRLPGALFSLGTMGLTYALGKILFSSRVAFWGTLVVATTHVFLWYGRRVLFDSALTFFMSLALLGWVQGYLLAASPLWFVVSFLGMGFGTITKSLHAFALPAVLMVAHSTIQKDFRAFRETWFWGGFVLFVLLVGGYSSMVSEGFQGHFSWKAGLLRAFDVSSLSIMTGGKPIYWYLYMMWFDFFPWCTLILPSVALWFSQRPLIRHPHALFVFLWVLGYFLMLSLSQLKREPYLMPLVPGLGLMIGYYYDSVFSSSETNSRGTLLERACFVLLALALPLALLFGPLLLHRKWHVPTSLFPVEYVGIMIALCCVLIGVSWRSNIQMACRILGVLAIGFVIGVVEILWPTIDRADSPRQVNQEVRIVASRLNTPIFQFGLTQEDLIYYLNSIPAITRLMNEEELVSRTYKLGEILVVTDRDDLESLSERSDLFVKPLHEFLQPMEKGSYKGFYLVSVKPAPTSHSEKLTSFLDQEAVYLKERDY